MNKLNIIQNRLKKFSPVLIVVVALIAALFISGGNISAQTIVDEVDIDSTTVTVWLSHGSCWYTGAVVCNPDGSGTDCDGKWATIQCDDGAVGTWCTNQDVGNASPYASVQTTYTCTYISEVTDWTDCRDDESSDDPADGLQYAADVNYDTIDGSVCSNVPLTRGCDLDYCTNEKAFPGNQTSIPANHFRNDAGECYPSIGASCTVDPDGPVDTGDTLTWTVHASGGDDSYTYGWNIDADNTGDSDAADNIFTTTYTTFGSKTATVDVTSAGYTETVTCRTGDDGNSGNPNVWVIDSSPHDGICGSVDKTTVSAKPTSGLCGFGTSYNMSNYTTGIGAGGIESGWTWNCPEINNGTEANCEAYHDGTLAIDNVQLDPIIVDSGSTCTLTWEVLGSGNYECVVNGTNVGIDNEIDILPGESGGITCTDLDTLQSVTENDVPECILNPGFIEN